MSCSENVPPEYLVKIEDISCFGANYYLTDSDGNECLNRKFCIGMSWTIVMVVRLLWSTQQIYDDLNYRSGNFDAWSIEYRVHNYSFSLRDWLAGRDYLHHRSTVSGTLFLVSFNFTFLNKNFTNQTHSALWKCRCPRKCDQEVFPEIFVLNRQKKKRAHVICFPLFGLLQRLLLRQAELFGEAGSRWFFFNQSDITGIS